MEESVRWPSARCPKIMYIHIYIHIDTHSNRPYLGSRFVRWCIFVGSPIIAQRKLKRALYTRKRALHTLKRALHTLKRALHTLKRALHKLKRATKCFLESSRCQPRPLEPSGCRPQHTHSWYKSEKYVVFE